MIMLQVGRKKSSKGSKTSCRKLGGAQIDLKVDVKIEMRQCFEEERIRYVYRKNNNKIVLRFSVLIIFYCCNVFNVCVFLLDVGDFLPLRFFSYSVRCLFIGSKIYSLFCAIERQMTEVKRVGRRRSPLLDDLRNRRRYWDLKEEAEDQNRQKRQSLCLESRKRRF